MALSCIARSYNRRLSSLITKPVIKWNVQNYAVRAISSGNRYERFSDFRSLEKKQAEVNYYGISSRNFRHYSTPGCAPSPEQEPPKKEGLMQKLKTMYKDYWYVVVPVHMTTSAIWFAGLYYTVRSGLDVVSLLESIGIGDTLIAPLRDSKAGYFALTFALYKVVSPLRYAVTIGGTTLAIKKLTDLGWIKPVPSKERIKEMIQVRKENFQGSLTKRYQDQRDRKTRILEDVRRYKTEIKNRMKKM